MNYDIKNHQSGMVMYKGHNSLIVFWFGQVLVESGILNHKSQKLQETCVCVGLKSLRREFGNPVRNETNAFSSKPTFPAVTVYNTNHLFTLQWNILPYLCDRKTILNVIHSSMLKYVCTEKLTSWIA